MLFKNNFRSGRLPLFRPGQSIKINLIKCSIQKAFKIAGHLFLVKFSRLFFNLKSILHIPNPNDIVLLDNRVRVIIYNPNLCKIKIKIRIHNLVLVNCHHCLHFVISRSHFLFHKPIHKRDIYFHVLNTQCL